jgi:hypothetical protein
VSAIAGLVAFGLALPNAGSGGNAVQTAEVTSLRQASSGVDAGAHHLHAALCEPVLLPVTP